MKATHALAAVAVLSIGMALPSAAAAQNRSFADVSAGYQVLGATGEIDETFVKGWYADFAGNVTSFLGLVFEIGGDYKSLDESFTFQGVTATAQADLSIHQFMGGARFNVRPNPTVTPFGQILVGAVRGSAQVSGSVTQGGEVVFSQSDALSSTNVGLQIGGGMDLQITDAVGIRVGGDYLRIFAEDEGINAFRFAIGAVFPF
jgi:opacity protein-like surface antigen